MDTSAVGSYTVLYTARFLMFQGTGVRTVNVRALYAPVLTLKGEETVTLTEGDAYEEPGWEAWDEVDGDLTDRVVTEGEADTAVPGTYTIRYEVKDLSGNSAEAFRTVEVQKAPERDAETGNPYAVFGQGYDIPAEEEEGKVIYLTFDDGPSVYTSDLLDMLDEYGVKATFFVVGNVHPEMITQEMERGHTVGLHSYSHVYSQVYESVDAFFEDLEAIGDLVQQRTGYESRLIRFPGGSSNTVSAYYTEGIMTELVDLVTEKGYCYFDWNVDSDDASSEKDPEKIAANMIEGIEKCNISLVLQHDTKETCTEATRLVIEWGLENGYTFLPLTEESYGAHQRVFN